MCEKVCLVPNFIITDLYFCVKKWGEIHPSFIHLQEYKWSTIWNYVPTEKNMVDW